MIDSHAHVGFPLFDDDRVAVVQRALDAGLTNWIEVGTDLISSRKAVKIAHEFSSAYATIGIHPSDINPNRKAIQESSTIDGLEQSKWDDIHRLLTMSKVVAIGEVGIDLYHRWPGYSLVEQRDKQIVVLRRFMDIAVNAELPVVFHVRSHKDMDAHASLLEVLESLPNDARPRGVLHTYSGNRDQALRYLTLGCYLSFSGVVTFKNAGEISDIARDVPSDRILIETDCPFLTPEPHRGQRNEPAYIASVAEKMSVLRRVSVDEIEKITEENTRHLFGLF